MSKVLTAIVVHRLLDENGLTPEEPVGNYLPSDWTRGTGVNQLRFRDFMKHRSGFGQIGLGSQYADLRSAVATNVGPRGFNYANANFGLMRVLVSGLLGFDPVDYPQFDPAAITAAFFLFQAHQIFEPIGVEMDCQPRDPTPTVQYRFPHAGLPGYVDFNRQLACGGIGWYASSNELAAVMTHLRNTESLLSDGARENMQGDFVGFMDPDNNYAFASGDFGVYYMHGGDWNHGPGDMNACVAAFPIQLEVALLINSDIGAGVPYQCTLLKNAFEGAWVED